VKKRSIVLAVMAVAGLALGGSVLLVTRSAATPPPPQRHYAGMGSLSDRPADNSLKNAYFGDLHDHTKTSVDSFLRKNMLTMADAYRFAQGAAVTTASGERVQLSRPLDFLALTDHSESYSTYDLCVEGTGPASRTEGCQLLKKGDNSLRVLRQYGGPWKPENCGGDRKNCLEAVKRVWRYVQQLAAQNYHPGKFTSFIGYEYSATTTGGEPILKNGGYAGHMHRNVIFRNAHVPDTVFSSLNGPVNTQLWAWLDKTCVKPCDVIAIPHNSNISWGLAFALETVKGMKYSTEDWKRRARYERLAEIFQIKGDSECGVGFGTTDEQCNYEQHFPPCTATKTDLCVKNGSFVRSALKTGLGLEKTLGFNPFKLGFIAGTDTHNAIPGATSEKGYPGSIGLADGTPETRLKNQLNRNPGGLAAVWATSNTRDSIFDALENREAFGTSGTRIRVRLFGGWNLPRDLHERRDFVALGYRLGVPMGSDLKPRGAAQAPTFAVWAAYDPQSARLQKIQIIKGWSAPDGQPSEQIYDVVCSDGITPDPHTHRCADNGAAVNLSDCSITPNKGADELATTWTDPDFDPKRPAFYYARVLEDPTCRWSTYDSIKLGRPVPPYPAPAQQERAWSSPIWYQSTGIRRFAAEHRAAR
jgi:hypothetical protein